MSGATETGPWLPTLARTVLTLGRGALVAPGRRIAETLVAWLVTGLLLIASLGFLTLSGYRAILASVGPVFVPLIVGCLYLVAGLVVVLARRR